jgi:uncharacterized coiled-coil protein SlyX
MTIEERLQILEINQKEQDNKIKELEEKVKFASIGFPVNFFK